MVDGTARNWPGPHGLRRRVRALTDPRSRRGVRHELTQVVLRALAAVVAGQRSLVAIGDGMQDLDPTQRAMFGGPRTGTAYRVPSEPTVRRGLQPLDGDALDAVLPQWLTAVEHRGATRGPLTARVSAARPMATGPAPSTCWPR